ncbi:TonB-dependent receptor [Tenacibaculum jejuense]|uniref:Probable TonB-dependent outer membrane receptor n=1 Tax=Tenacibaculum jejuense TaxID=584609 RepID=A0A238U6Y2_9FLAO|nr:TonB-dependent receptor [Tenacibaculum jejuense]SNR14961.1 Probable TonB-dependent outer membrane receptor precursor [Tenacibaculum jejuense]
MKFRKLVLGIFIFLVHVSFSQSRITGTVLDTDNTPIFGANVILTKASKNIRGVVTDYDGKFILEASKNDDYLIRISFVGFETQTKAVTIADNNIDLGNIILKESAELLQSVEIIGRKRDDYNSDYSFSATKIAIKNKELPQAVSTVTKELIADRQAFQLTEAVKTVSNVSITGLYNHYNIRGITQADDGQVVNGMRTRQFYFIQPITSHLERVEVIKGPSSVTFSSADPGGTVNMVTKKPLKEKRSEISIAAGSFGTLRTTADFTGPLNEEKTLLYRFNAAYQEADSFRDIVNNNTFLVSPSISYIPNESTALNVEMIYNLADGNLDRGQPIFTPVGADYDPNSTPISLNPGALNDFYNTKEVMFMASFSKKFTENFGFNAQYMKQTWDEDLKEHRADAFRGAYDINGDIVPNLIAMRYNERQQAWNTNNVSTFFNYDIKNDNFTNKILVGYDATRWERGVYGTNTARDYLLLDGSTKRFRPSGANATDPADFQQANGLLVPAVPHLDLTNPFNGIRNTSSYALTQTEIPANFTTSDGIYLQNQFKIGKFSALVNLRYEWFSDIFDYNGTNEQKFRQESFIPRLGLTYEITDDISAYGTYLEGFQPHTNTVSLSPSAEGFFGQASPGRFDPLESRLLEFGAKGYFLNGKLNANFALFEVTQKNILVGDVFVREDLTTIGKQRSRGFEMDISGYLTPDFQITASYGFNDAKIIEDSVQDLVGERIGGAPKHNFNFWGRYDFTTKTLKDIGIGFGAQYVDERFTWYTPSYLPDRVLLPEYTVFDAALYYKPANTGIQLTLKANNVFDKKYWLGGLFPSRLAPGAPSNVLLNVTYKF